MTVAVILIIFLVLFLLWPSIVRLLRPMIQRWMLRRVENVMRRATGIPPRDTERKKSTKRKSRQKNPDWQKSASSSSGHQKEPIIPREYAVDVEFTETVSYSAEETIGPDGHHTERVSFRRETQVSDVEWEEIKK